MATCIYRTIQYYKCLWNEHLEQRKSKIKICIVVSRQHTKKNFRSGAFFFFALEKFFDIYGQKLAISDVGEYSNFEACLLKWGKNKIIVSEIDNNKKRRHWFSYSESVANFETFR